MFSVLRSRSALSREARRLIHSVTLPPLPYAYDALAPVISKDIMELHHRKHHQTYVNNLNNLLQTAESDDLAVSIRKQAAIKFNGGGHLNHSIFWTNLAPPKEGGGEVPKSGELVDAIRESFGDVSEFQKNMNAEAAAVQGSGWAWLVYNKPKESLSIMTTSNQDPVVGAGITPLLGIDVWEHAYYLDYKNVRPEYLKQIWKVVNWANIDERFHAAKYS